MKLNIYTLAIYILVGSIGKAQFIAGPLSTGSISNNSAPGTVWSATNNPTPSGGCSLPAYGYTKGLIVNNFGFSIPLTASITGIESAFSYSPTSYIKDTTIKLLINNIEVGNNKALNSTLPSNSVSYGSSSDLWGLSIINSSDINSPTFGFVIYVNNPYPFSNDLNFLPFLPGFTTFNMTVYYSNVMGITEAQTRSVNMIIYPQPAKDILNVMFQDYYEPAVTVKIFDVNGKIIHDTELAVRSGKAQIETSGLSNGVYVLQLQNSRSQITQKKLVITK